MKTVRFYIFLGLFLSQLQTQATAPMCIENFNNTNTTQTILLRKKDNIKKQQEPSLARAKKNPLHRYLRKIRKKIQTLYKHIQKKLPDKETTNRAISHVIEIYGSSFLMHRWQGVSKETTARGLITRLFVGAGTRFFALVAHETGHAIAALLTKSKSINVYIGKKGPSDYATIKLSPEITYHLTSLLPNEGFTSYTIQNKQSKTAKLYRKMSGGISGLAGLFILVFIRELYLQKNKHNLTKEGIKHSLLTAATPKIWDINTLLQMEQLLTNQKGWDGKTLWSFMYYLCNKGKKRNKKYSRRAS